MQTSAPLSTLLLIFVWILSILASPLPPIDDSTQVSRSYRRADSQAHRRIETDDAHAKPKYQIKLEIAISLKGTIKEHSFLVIGNTILHAEWPDDYLDDPELPTPVALVPKVYKLTAEKARVKKKKWDWISIGEASLDNENDEEIIIKSALAIKMPARKSNGGCRDFIKMVLGMLHERGYVDESVVKGYGEIYEERARALQEIMSESD
ncbi:hypothetical protein DFJ43DRAFT_1080126 [Lentinula guzmanii]|uniref:Uncharacterized protein n=1 Tax=Lentinula guzmanii TaxID=2804957 RepID=A0AA38MSZ6_9AGAR|nr:hypothetical protein DFJ43DRAFT_1080126 [Lentinula guzmanii]